MVEDLSTPAFIPVYCKDAVTKTCDTGTGTDGPWDRTERPETAPHVCGSWESVGTAGLPAKMLSEALVHGKEGSQPSHTLTWKFTPAV